MLAVDGIGDAGAAGFLRSEIDDAGIQGEQQIVAAAVEGKLFYCALSNQTAYVQSGGAYDRSIGPHCDFRLYRVDLQAKIDAGFLIYNELDARAGGVLESGLGDGHFVFADREGQNSVAA